MVFQGCCELGKLWEEFGSSRQSAGSMKNTGNWAEALLNQEK